MRTLEVVLDDKDYETAMVAAALCGQDTDEWVAGAIAIVSHVCTSAPSKRMRVEAFISPKELAERWCMSIGELDSRSRLHGTPNPVIIAGKLLYRLKDVVVYEKHMMERQGMA